MKLVLIHGVSAGRSKHWGWQWAGLLKSIMPEQPSEVLCLGWEEVHESKYEPTTSARDNLLMDLGALNNARVHGYLHDRLREVEGSEEPVWIIAHSLGCPLIYQALDYLQYGRAPRLWITRLITLGSPLWLPYSRIVRRFCSLNIAMPRASKLTNVGAWVDIQGRLDPIAGLGLVRMPAAGRYLRPWCRHPFDHYARSGALRRALAARLEDRRF